MSCMVKLYKFRAEDKVPEEVPLLCRCLNVPVTPQYRLSGLLNASAWLEMPLSIVATVQMLDAMHSASADETEQSSGCCTEIEIRK